MIDARQNALTILPDERTWMAAAQRTSNTPDPETRWRPRMKRKSRISAALAIIVASAIAPHFADSNKPSSPVTVRDLARELVSAAGTNGPEVSGRLSEIDLGRALNAPLTEGDAAALLRAAGFMATASEPGRLLSRDRADALVKQFKASFVSAPAKASNSRGDGKHTADFESCVQAENHGKCVNCCKEQGGGSSSCAKLCFEINKPSPSEPLP